MMAGSLQIPIPFPRADAGEAQAGWLGLVIDHRRLFDALQDGWLRPFQSRPGILVGIGAYIAERVDELPANRIPVRIKLGTEMLPTSDVQVLRGRQWVSSRIEEFESSDSAVYWPGALPTFSILEISVASEEELARLEGLCQAVSNVDLIDVPLRIATRGQHRLELDVDLPQTTTRLVIPDSVDAIHGSLSMAVWGVPRIDPWLDILTAGLASNLAELPKLAALVGAPWWRFPPWSRVVETPSPADVQECLWLAAIDVFRKQRSADRVGPYLLSDRIAAAALQYECLAISQTVSDWSASTHSILRAESKIPLAGWKRNPVGLALQLVLTRPDPRAFKGWFKDVPELPPTVAWSASALCGLLHGYRRLPSQFRGGSVQREILSILALQLSGAETTEMTWPSVSALKPSWHRESSEFVLSWGSRGYARKHQNARGGWFAADFDDAEVRHQAQSVAKERAWPCVHRAIDLTDGRLSLSGSGSVVPTDPARQLDVHGSVRMRLPDNAVVEEVLDIELFRHLVAVETGPVAGPAASRPAGLCAKSPDIPGLTYVREFLSRSEEKRVVRQIDRSHWRTEGLTRRVQHYGWRYDYKTRNINTTARLGSLPDWAASIARRLVSAKFLEHLPDQVIVNEYINDQGIGRHVDRIPLFADGIVMISLLESWEMIFRKRSSKDKVSHMLERRSAAILRGDARYKWTHEIPRRKYEPGGLRRQRRISLTFRKVVVPRNSEYTSR